jgi:CRISPR-associated protein Csm5
LKEWIYQQAPALKFETFLACCRDSVAELLEREKAFYQEFGLAPLREFYEGLQTKLKMLQQEQALLLPLGWGTGWRSKTLAMLHLKDEFELWLRRELKLKPEQEVYPRARHIFMQNDKPKQPLGWVELAFKPSRKTELVERKVVMRKF